MPRPVTSPVGNMGRDIIVQNYDVSRQQVRPFVMQARCNLSCVPKQYSAITVSPCSGKSTIDIPLWSKMTVAMIFSINCIVSHFFAGGDMGVPMS